LAEERFVDVPMPYWLFSHSMIAGIFQSAAMLTASYSCPWFAAPSPYIVTQTGTPPGCVQFFFALYISAKATPTPTGTCGITAWGHEGGGTRAVAAWSGRCCRVASRGAARS
jgi:hypothetical protein